MRIANNHILVSWIGNNLTEQPQYVRLGSTMSDTVITTIGASGYNVIPISIYRIYCWFFIQVCIMPCTKDDTAVACVKENKEEEYKKIISDFTDWFNYNSLI